jgi:hypothetical protein
MESSAVLFILLGIVFFSAVIYLWLVEDQKKTSQVRADLAEDAPLDLKREVRQLSDVNPQDPQPFFDNIAKLKGRCSRYPQLQSRLVRKERNARIALLAYKHQATLLRNLRKAIKKDDYGTIIEDTRTEEIMRFLESMGFEYDENDSPEDVAVVESVAEQIREADAKEGFDPNEAPKDGIAFEHWVSDQSSKFGWEATVSQPGSDQGVDIIAKYKGVKVGIQCKRYTANVGNKAVQEAFSAKQYFDLDKVIVMTTSGYTQSAIELAKPNDVGLYTVEDIPTLAKQLHLA